MSLTQLLPRIRRIFVHDTWLWAAYRTPTSPRPFAISRRFSSVARAASRRKLRRGLKP